MPESLGNFPETTQFGGEGVGLSQVSGLPGILANVSKVLALGKGFVKTLALISPNPFSQKVHPQELSEVSDTCKVLQDVWHTAEGVCLPGSQATASEENL